MPNCPTQPERFSHFHCPPPCAGFWQPPLPLQSSTTHCPAAHSALMCGVYFRCLPYLLLLCSVLQVPIKLNTAVWCVLQMATVLNTAVCSVLHLLAILNTAVWCVLHVTTILNTAVGMYYRCPPPPCQLPEGHRSHFLTPEPVGKKS